MNKYVQAFINKTKALPKGEKILIGFWSFLNLIICMLYLASGSGFFASLIFFIFWEAVLFGYYLTKVRDSKKSGMREWGDAIVFAVIAATLIRTFFIEAYQIPTPSMEKNLLVGDFLFVSKAHYGARLPMTPIAVPFTHQDLPGGLGKAYLTWLQMSYYRLPALQDIEKGDVVVFNWPNDSDDIPLDKKMNYIKRCVGTPGDTLRIIDKVVHVGGKQYPVPDKGEYSYLVYTKTLLSAQALLKQDITGPYWDNLQTGQRVFPIYDDQSGAYVFNLTEEKVKHIKETWQGVDSIVMISNLHANISDRIYPQKQEYYPWDRDNFGPIWIPAKGSTIELNEKNFYLYQRVIRDYEHNPDFRMVGNEFMMGDKTITEYTFKQNYYFMMGDNRHNSEDSRYWGFVPHDHVVGKALFIWFSSDPYKSFPKNIRWSRIFKGVN